MPVFWVSFRMYFPLEPMPDSFNLQQLVLRQLRQIACSDNSEVGVHTVAMSAVWYLPRCFLPVKVEEPAPGEARVVVL